MAVEAAIAISAGVAARSIALNAFGADSLIELFSATVALPAAPASRRGRRRDELSAGERQVSRPGRARALRGDRNHPGGLV